MMKEGKEQNHIWSEPLKSMQESPHHQVEEREDGDASDKCNDDFEIEHPSRWHIFESSEDQTADLPNLISSTNGQERLNQLRKEYLNKDMRDHLDEKKTLGEQSDLLPFENLKKI